VGISSSSSSSSSSSAPTHESLELDKYAPTHESLELDKAPAGRGESVWGSVVVVVVQC
jgi:hypothetical protein